VQLGLDGDGRERLRCLVGAREQPTPRRRRIRPVAQGVSLVVSTHGVAGGPLRDAVIRDFLVEADPA
jgi:hypothetical protein